MQLPQSPMVGAPDAGVAVAQGSAPDPPTVAQLNAAKKRLLDDEKRLEKDRKVRAQIKAKLGDGSSAGKKSGLPSKKGLSKEEDLEDPGVSTKQRPSRKSSPMLKAD